MKASFVVFGLTVLSGVVAAPADGHKPEYHVKKPEHYKPEHHKYPEHKPVHKPEHKPKHKPEHKPKHYPKHKPEHKPKHYPKHKPEKKPEHKPGYHDKPDYYDWKDQEFTSSYSIVATPDQVVNATADGTGFYFTGGLPGTIGYYEYAINSETNLICYDITLEGFRGQYESPANTATHIHEGVAGETGPPRIAFPNPKPAGKGVRVSVGCLQGPFLTGVIDTETGLDTGTGFEVAQIEENPVGFFTDVHSSLAVPGAVRGQFA